MKLFDPNASLKVLVLWARVKPFAEALGARLEAETAEDISVRVMTQSQSLSDLGEMSKAAIDAADCILMVAADEHWEGSLSARQEWRYFFDLARSAKKRESQWRWVKAAGRPCPSFHAAYTRNLSVADAEAPTERELANILDFLEDERARKAGKPRTVPLDDETLAYPSGLLTATLWLISLEEEVWNLDAAGTSFRVRGDELTSGLKYLKALHSIHAGLGAFIKEPLHRMATDYAETRITDVSRVRRDLGSYLDITHGPLLGMNLKDCIGQGLLPALAAFGRRLEALPGTEEERRFIAAASERLEAILSEGEVLQHLDAHQPGDWWVKAYSSVLDRLGTSARGFLLDSAAWDFVQSGRLGGRAIRLRDTHEHAMFLHIATLQLTFTVLTIFSFVHAHRAAEVASLKIERVEHALDQVCAFWGDTLLTDGVVNWSNKLIRDHLAALEEYESEQYAAV